MTASGSFLRRILVLGIFVAVGVAVLAVTLAKLQLGHADEYRRLADRNAALISRTAEKDAPR